MSDVETIRSQLDATQLALLQALATLGLGPHTDLSKANGNRVIERAMELLGIYDDETRRIWRKKWEHPEVERIYLILIDMVHAKPSPLVEGGGNWGGWGGPAAMPFFVSCRLSQLGERVQSATGSESKT